ncbi:MAG TPA: hypothetical protein VK484_11450 [Ferruginibacter sp.]|nr:hypothetical protein [Ferruginibacter sp.]
MSELNEDNYQSFLHGVVDDALDLDSFRSKEIKLEERVNSLVNELGHLKALLEDICDIHHNKIKIPHRCPVCNGSTLDEKGDLCIPCDGRGIAWG